MAQTEQEQKQQLQNVQDASASAAPSAAESMTLPLELIDQCIGKRLRVYLAGSHVFEGKLVGFDDLVNLVMDNVVETTGSGEIREHTSEKKRMLISSRSLTMLVPLE
jgi:U6 snRNA-associated Sm-like protein LSm5